jgi:uridine kinase
MNKPYIVGIAGGSASGKTSFIKDLRNSFAPHELSVVSQDNYYRPLEEQLVDENGQVNFDLPESINRTQFYDDMVTLAEGKNIKTWEYTFNVNPVEPKSIEVFPAPIIIMEGLFVFHYEEIRKLLDLRVYIDVRDSIKLQRRLKRDQAERGYNAEAIQYQWDHHVMPSYKKYLRPYRDDAHIIITNNHHYTKGLEVLFDHLKCKLNK